jgi:hypothetical protein
MNRLLSCTMALALLAAAPAQDQATTLLACAKDAAVVVRATVLFASDPTPEWHRLQFRADAVLKGTVGAEFVLLEPAGACCGRSLFAMQPGDRCLLFLKRTGSSLHPLGGSRGVLADSPAITAHVQALLAAGTDTDTAGLLVAGLTNAEPRIAADAAQALAVLPTLPLSTAHKDTLATALVTAMQSGTTTAAPLLDVAARLQDPFLLQALMPTYLATPRADQALLMRRSIQRWAPEVVLAAVPAQATGDTGRDLRTAELLAALPADAVGPTLRTMLATTGCPRVKLCTGEALLAAGATTTELAPWMPAPVLQLAARRTAEARPFRSIQPNRP